MWILFLAFIFGGSVTNGAKTDAELKEEFTKVVMSCAKDYPVEITELVKLQGLKTPKKSDVKCLLGCTYKKIGTMNDKGMFDLEKMYKLAEVSKEGDEKAIADGKKLADICEKVNDGPVSDGDKGCDRAALMFECIITNAPKLGFTV